MLRSSGASPSRPSAVDAVTRVVPHRAPTVDAHTHVAAAKKRGGGGVSPKDS